MSADSLDDDLLRLDKLWEREREQYMISGQPATWRTSLITLIVGAGLGAGLIALGCTGKFALGFMIGPVAFVGGVLFGLLGMQKARQYDAAEQVYLQRREELEKKQSAQTPVPPENESEASAGEHHA